MPLGISNPSLPKKPKIAGLRQTRIEPIKVTSKRPKAETNFVKPDTKAPKIKGIKVEHTPMMLPGLNKQMGSPGMKRTVHVQFGGKVGQ